MQRNLLIVCLVLMFAACCQPRQAATSLEVSPVHRIGFHYPIHLPQSAQDTIVVLPGNIDESLVVELERSWLEIQQLESEMDSLIKLKIKSGIKKIVDTVSVNIETKIYVIRTPGVDSVFQIFNKDTLFIHSYSNNWKYNDLLNDIKIATESKSFPWTNVLITLIALIAYYIYKKKRD